MSANDTQIGGEHYKGNAIQVWDFIVSNGLGYLEGNVVKYVSRWRKKNGLQDLEKAAHYLAKLIEVAKAEQTATIGEKLEDAFPNLVWYGNRYGPATTSTLDVHGARPDSIRKPEGE